MLKLQRLVLLSAILGVWAFGYGLADFHGISENGDSVLPGGEGDEDLDYDFRLPKRRLGSSFQDEEERNEFWDHYSSGRQLQSSSKSTKAPSIKSTKAPSMKSTKAPSLKSTKAPSLKSTKAPSLKSTKAPTCKSSKSNIFC